jgi:hypothetical protein
VALRTLKLQTQIGAAVEPDALRRLPLRLIASSVARYCLAEEPMNVWSSVPVLGAPVPLGKPPSGFACILLTVVILGVLILIALFGPTLQGNGRKTCPKCAEQVREDAAFCKGCGHRFRGTGRTGPPGRRSG